MSRLGLLRFTLGSTIAALIVLVPYVYYRCEYTHHKRFREVDPGRYYRSGQLSLEGFTEAVQRYGIRTIINLQEENPDPEIRGERRREGCEKESELCGRLGVRYVFLPLDLVPRREESFSRPRAIERFLTIMDDPSSYPVLVHCRAGLHRTGVLTALYRVEYEGWNARDAIDEVKANGFGYFACSSANSYVSQYILNHRPRK